MCLQRRQAGDEEAEAVTQIFHQTQQVFLDVARTSPPPHQQFDAQIEAARKFVGTAAGDYDY